MGVPARKGVTGFGVTVKCQVGRCVIGHTLVAYAAAICGVAVKFDGIVIGSPLGIQGNGFAFDGRQIYHILSIGVGNSSTILLGVPARKGVTGFGVAIKRQVGRRIISHGLAGCTAAIGGVAVKFDGVVVGPPLSVQLYCISFDRCEVFNIFSIRIGGSTAILLGIPADKGIACFSVAIGRQVGYRIISHALAGCTAAIGGISVKCNGIMICLPLSI